ncbi:MAG: DNA primase [Proteobacteria bacterium]|nr:DNA primase [Pseudomonadota bacterium]
MKINRELIKEKINIVEYISRYVSLNKRGKNYVGLCPFHQEKTPSFTVSENKQIFYCFGCHIGGDILEFLKRYLKLDYLQILEILEKETGLKLFDRDKEYDKKLKEARKITEINKRATVFFINNLYKTSDGAKALNYLKNRNLTIETIKRFYLGYGGADWDRLYRTLISENFDRKDIEKTGLISVSSGGVRDFFRNRVIFPIVNIKGEIIAFGGRSLDSSLPKYVNSQETIVFSKRNTLYGINIAKENLERSKRVYIVEGYMDCLMMHQAGFNNTVATLGTAITEEHIKFLKPLVEVFYLIYDGDVAGKKAALRGVELFLNLGINPHIVILPEGEDPDSLIAKGLESELKNAIDSAKNGIDFLINFYKMLYSLSSVTGQRAFILQIKKHIENITNPLERALLIRSVSEQTGFTKEEILDIFQIKEKSDIINLEVNNTPEDTITAILIKNPEYITQIENEILANFSKEHISVIDKFVTSKKTDDLSDVESQLYYRLTILSDSFDENTNKIFFDNLIFLKKRHYERINEELTNKIKIAEKSGDFTRVKELLRKKDEIKNKQKELLKLRSN